MVIASILVNYNNVKFCFCLGKNKIDLLEKNVKEKDMSNIMVSN